MGTLGLDCLDPVETPCFAAFSWGGEKRRGRLLRKDLGPEGEAGGCQDWRIRDKLHLQPLPYRPKLSLLHKAAERHNPESGDLTEYI